jgi:NAD(P)-dependent dehydrogenase (short-subunit alcohol dehydrogenase family)
MAMVEETVHLAGKVDILVNCIGMHIEKPAEEYSLEDWDLVNDVNLRGAFLLSQAAGRQMIRQDSGGKHIHITSVRSVLGIRRGYISYCTTKGGLNMLVKQLATEWAKYQITVNAVAPTFIRTDLVKHYLEDRDFYNALVNRIPLGRVGEPLDVAGATLFLASPAGDFITGHVLMVDGGVTATQ